MGGDWGCNRYFCRFDYLEYFASLLGVQADRVADDGYWLDWLGWFDWLEELRGLHWLDWLHWFN